MQSDESSSDEDANKPSHTRVSDDSDAAASPVQRKVTGSDSSEDEKPAPGSDYEDDRYFAFLHR